jgi:hypothetical protein
MSGSAPQAGWYPDPSDGSRRRYWDGYTWGFAEPVWQPPPPSAPPLRKKRRGLLILGAILGLCVVLVALGQNSDKQKAKAPSPTSDVPSPTLNLPSPPPGDTPSAAATAPPTPGIGQEVRDGKLAFVVTSVDQSKTAGDPSNQFETVTAQGQFLNVHMTVSNVGDQSQSFFATNQKLQIGAQEFSADDAAAMWTQSANVSINPGNSIQAVVSFDLPPSTPQCGLLTVHDSLFSGGAQISLESAG